MNLFVEHDAAALARIAGSAAPACDGLIVQHGRPDVVLAATIRSNPLSSSWLLDVDLPSDRVVTWSGTLAGNEPADLFTPHPLNWLRTGREALARFCAEIAPQLASHKRTLCFQPHHRHVLSDLQSSLNFLREHQGEPFEIALAPASLLVPSMLEAVEDHLTRTFEALGGRCAMVFLADVRIVQRSDDDEPACETVPLGDGVLPRDLVLKLLREHVPPPMPVVISSGKIGQQVEWLAGG